MTRTAEAIALATEKYQTKNAPTKTPTNTPIPTSTKTPSPTETPAPTRESSQTPLEPTPAHTKAPSTPTTEPASPTPSAPQVVITGEQVNVRSGPGTDYPVIQALTQDEAAPATGFNAGRTWVQIELEDGSSGWVSKDLVEVLNSSKLATITDIPPAPTAAVSAEQPAASAGDSGSSGTASGGTGSPFQCIGGCAVAPDPSCAIKGNVNNKGEKIYHMPWGHYYEDTDIEPEKGDRWFCTEEEAIAAGFLRAKS